MALFMLAARCIEMSSESATIGLDREKIANALANMLSNKEGTLDLSPIMIGLSKSGLSEIINSWMGNGANLPILPEQVVTLLGEERVNRFSDELGISLESAQAALSAALPQVVDMATGGSETIVDEMLGQVSGSQGTMEMLSKMFR